MIRNVVRQLTRAARRRGGGGGRAGKVKGAAKGAAKWAAKQGAKKAAVAVAAAVAANPAAWIIAGAAALAGGMILAVVLLSAMFGGGDLESEGIGGGYGLSYEGAAGGGEGGRAVFSGILAFLSPESDDGRRRCDARDRACARVLINEERTGGGAVLEHWRRGAGGFAELEGEEVWCPIPPAAVTGSSRRSWGDARGGGARFHAGVDIYNDNRTRTAVIAVQSGVITRIVHRDPVDGKPKWNSFFLRPEGKGWLWFYTHIDDGGLPAVGTPVTGGEPVPSPTSRDGLSTITNPKTSHVDDAHVHLGIETGLAKPGGQGVGDYDPWPAVMDDCGLRW